MAPTPAKVSQPTSSPPATPKPSVGLPAGIWKYLVPVAVGLVLWFLPAPAGLQPKAWHMFAVFVATIAGIMTAPLPMSVVAIIGSTIGVLVGVLTFADVTRSTGTDLVWLVMLAFFISRGVIKTGLGRRIALLFMRLLGKRTTGLGYGLVLTELVISPAMPSITARAGGVMLPITRAISEVLGSHADDPESRAKVGRYLILCAFHANIITAGMFITAMAGNPLAVKLAADQGVSISWLDWALAASIPGLLCLAVIPIAMLWIAPPHVRRTPDATDLAQRELATMGSISVKEIIMACIFVGLLVLWVFGDDLGIGATLAAAIGVSLLFISGVLTWQDALNEKSAWDTMIWIGLLIMLASKLNEYGMVAWFGKEFGQHLAGFPMLAVYMLVAAIYVYIHYFFASATAHISALFPLSMALMVAAGVPPFVAAVSLGILSNVNGCLTQYGIGSGPVMFGAGYVTQGEWWKAGFLMSLFYMVAWLVVGPLWWKLLGHI
ncbi:DASS family divalent anion:Na+ symporter [Paraburkholderia youngii]|uniref:DASS family divalent anion:Na+ symporter n=1 Tax=Paraburkholderia youngii TaxID=2782701 RepID=A0A7W8P3X9_9BURK|nr:DASS family sodium-coupled anion symporter [Paraburkholderia youngii]MBB5402706.1 DASS family divalent anion:Na+ symporter [Paraburkholderia youngii]NUX57523.1 DASS family sodium-coupled anion symporter [Paraburkholderia youngii]NVI04371.1 DASS family sodium-coupled anion symporter [Paraburkholderia youngii]